MSTPTDCPSREKRGWTGDGQAAAETLIYNFDMSVNYPKWLGDIADAQQCNFHAVGRKCSEDEPFCSGMLTQGGQGGHPVPLGSRLHSTPTHFLLSLHGV